MIVDQTNWADVAKQAMDMLGKGIQNVVDVVEKAAPLVWKLAVRQAWIEGFEWLVSGILLFIALALVARRFKEFAEKTVSETLDPKSRSHYDDSLGQTGARNFSMLFWCLAFISQIPFVTSAIDCLMNPQWQAIRILIDQAAKMTGAQPH